jgi:hypothetical protein
MAAAAHGNLDAVPIRKSDHPRNIVYGARSHDGERQTFDVTAKVSREGLPIRIAEKNVAIELGRIRPRARAVRTLCPDRTRVSEARKRDGTDRNSNHLTARCFQLSGCSLVCG